MAPTRRKGRGPQADSPEGLAALLPVKLRSPEGLVTAADYKLRSADIADWLDSRIGKATADPSQVISQRSTLLGQVMQAAGVAMPFATYLRDRLAANAPPRRTSPGRVAAPAPEPNADLYRRRLTQRHR